MNEPTQLTHFQNEIRQQYDKLSKRLKQVAQYILDNEKSVVFDTVSIIAERANVPPSTLIRFARFFGFSGFNEIKQLYRQNLMEETANYVERVHLYRQIEHTETKEEASDILNVFVKSNHQALQQLVSQTNIEQLEIATNLLNEAHKIFIVGLKRSFSIASYLNYALHHLNCDSTLIDGLGGMFDEQLSRVKSGDLVIAISFSPYAKETLEVMNATSKSGVKHIAITDSQLSPLLPFSDASFIIKEAQVNGFRSQCSTMTLVQSLAVALAMKRENV